MFLRSVITDEISQSLEEAAKLASRFGLEAVELRTVDEKNPFGWTEGDVARFSEILERYGLHVCCIASPFYKCAIGDAEDRAAHIEGLKRCVVAAQKLGARLIRGFCFWNEGDLDERLEEIVKYFEEPVRVLRDAGMTMVLESEPSVYSHNAATLAKVVEAIGSAHVRAVWDPGNNIHDAQGEVPYPDGYQIIKPYMAHVHLKDAARIDGEPVGVPIGKGQAVLEEQLAALISDGYSGYVSLETHYRLNHQMDDDLLARPGGSAFSHLGYEATEECLHLWRDMMNKIHPGIWRDTQ